MQYIEKEDHILSSLSPEIKRWIPSIRGRPNCFLKHFKENNLQSKVKSLVVYTDLDLPSDSSAYEETCIAHEVHTLWTTIFSTINPTRILVAAPPATMAALTSSRIATPDTWAFQFSLHYLEFRLPEAPPSPDNSSPEASEPSHSVRTCLHNMRKWTHMAYNEGTMLPAYATYEYFGLSPPKMLGFLLTWIQKEHACPTSPKLRSFRYISLFPLSGHVASTLEPLLHMGSEMRRLHFRFAPDRHSDVLGNERVGKADRNDLWAEWKVCYGSVVQLARKLGEGGRDVEIELPDYGTEALNGPLDRRLKLLQSVGWVRRGQSWVRTTEKGSKS